MNEKSSRLARVLYALYLLCAILIVILVMCAPPLRLIPPPPAPIKPVTLTSTPTIHPTITQVWTLSPTISATPSRANTLSPSATNTATFTPLPPSVTRSPSPSVITTPGRNTLPNTGADATDLFFSGALQPLGNIDFPFTLAEFLGYLAGGILTYPASKFIFEKLDEWLPELFGKPKLTRAQKRFLAYPIAALIAVGATVLLHYLGYAPLSMDALYKAFGTAFLTAQALHGYFDLTGADPAVESKNALVNLFAAVKGFQFAHVDAKVSEQGELRERYLELLNAAAEAEKFLHAGAKK